MKKFRLAAAVSVAVLSMSAQAMAAPLTTNATAQLSCQKVATLTNCNFDSQSVKSIRLNCLNSIDIESILSQLNCSGGKAGKTVTSLVCNLGGTSGGTGTDCTGSDCTGSDCTAPTNNTATNKTATNKTTTNNTATNKTTTNNTATNKTATNNTTTNNTTTNNTATNKTATNNTTTNNTATNNTATNNTTTNKTTTQTTTSVSAYAQKVVDLVNAERAKAGLSALQIDPAVTKAAQVRAKEIKTSFSHTRPDGRSCFTALDEAKASYRGAGENIALGQKTPEEVMNGWMNSAGHKANIMNPNFKYIGVGVDGNAWTQMFTY